MLKINGLMTVAAAALMLTAVQVSAGSQTKIYAYATIHNFCPAGLQPVSISGTVCCGTPNQNVTYQHVMAHPVAARTHQPVRHHQPRHSSRADCPIGTKGCTFD